MSRPATNNICVAAKSTRGLPPGVRFALKPIGVCVVALGAACGFPLRAANATAPVDAAQRNTPFATGTAVAPAVRTPETAAGLQDRRVNPAVVDKKTSPLGERRAAVEMAETHPKDVRDKETVEKQLAPTPPRSAFDHRQAGMSTAADTTTPPKVAKYQDSLTAASASNMARFPAADRATAAKINRFVFRKNPADTGAVTTGAAVTPAAGGGSPGR